MIRIWVEGHEQTHDVGIASGHKDVELTDVGRERARTVLREKYAGFGLDMVFTSDMQRAYETAQLAFEGRDIPIVKDARLRECDYGELTGAPQPEIAAIRPQTIDRPFPGGESYTQVAERHRQFLDHLTTLPDVKRVMLIGHRSTFWMLRHWLKGVPLREAVNSPITERPEVFEYDV